MKKALKITTIIALWFIVSFAFWIAILLLYFVIAEPETFTKFEQAMSLLVSFHIAEKLIDVAFKAQEETPKGGVDE